jgi:hypothetical protein
MFVNANIAPAAAAVFTGLTFGFQREFTCCDNRFFWYYLLIKESMK